MVFEDPANITLWAQAKGHHLTKTLLFNHEVFPSLKDFDWLVVMGGPMSVNDEQKYPWLLKEKKFVEQAIAESKTVLGICLGAQLIANVFGAKVYKNQYKEIGWYPVSLTEEANKSEVFKLFPKTFTAFHWHGETFDLPAGCERIAQSEGCLNQAFEYDRRVVGLQFHLESSQASIQRLIENCPEDFDGGKYTQSTEQILSQQKALQEIRRLMTDFLDVLEATSQRFV